MTYAQKLKDPRWQKRRIEVFARDNATCQLCKDTTTEVHIHHLKYTKEPWDTPLEDLITYCKHCHSVVEFFKDKKRLKSIYKEQIDVDYYLLAATNEISALVAFFYYYISTDTLEFVFCSPIWFIKNVHDSLLTKITTNGKAIH